MEKLTKKDIISNIAEDSHLTKKTSLKLLTWHLHKSLKV